MANTSLDYTDIIEAKNHFHDLQYAHWLQYELFTYQWWTLLGVLVIPWLIWWRLVDKSRTSTILSYGFYVMFVVIAMDAIGIVHQLWIYPIKLIPIIPHIVPIDWSMFPVLYMLIYQYFPRWKEFLIAESIFAALISFVGEPLGEWIGIYFVLHWHHIWSFPIYVMIAGIGKWMIESIVWHR